MNEWIQINSNTPRQIHCIIDITSTFPLWHDWITHRQLILTFTFSHKTLRGTRRPNTKSQIPAHLLVSVNTCIPATFRQARRTPHHFVNLKGGISSKKGFIASCRLHMIDSTQWSLCTGRRMPHCGPTASVWNKTWCQAFLNTLSWVIARGFQ